MVRDKTGEYAAANARPVLTAMSVTKSPLESTAEAADRQDGAGMGVGRSRAAGKLTAGIGVGAGCAEIGIAGGVVARGSGDTTAVASAAGVGGTDERVGVDSTGVDCATGPQALTSSANKQRRLIQTRSMVGNIV